MKIDLAVLRAIEKSGGSAAAVIAVLELQIERGDAKRKRDREAKIISRAGIGPRQQATESDKKRHERTMEDDTKRQEATLSDTARARLFREGSAALMTLGRTERAARGLIAGWLKSTHDDEQLVLATIMKAQSLAVADYAGWITSNLNKRTGNGQRSSIMATADDLITRAKELELEAGFGGEPDEAFAGFGKGS